MKEAHGRCRVRSKESDQKVQLKGQYVLHDTNFNMSVTFCLLQPASLHLHGPRNRQDPLENDRSENGQSFVAKLQ